MTVARIRGPVLEVLLRKSVSRAGYHRGPLPQAGLCLWKGNADHIQNCNLLRSAIAERLRSGLIALNWTAG